MFAGRCDAPFAEGDGVILYERHDRMNAIWLKEKEVVTNRFGTFKHNDIIGLTPGSKIYSMNRGGWMYALRPTPEMWTLALKHRTQILYNTDISVVCMQLELKPGSIVVEAGTGSGSLTHSLARCVMPSGQVFTHDFHAERAKEAAEEFAKNGLSSVITVNHRDVCAAGFVCPEKVDAVFLDLPAPWTALDHVTKVLKAGGRFCSFSPCIEQVQEVCNKLREGGYSNIITLETLVRPYEITSIFMEEPQLVEVAPQPQAKAEKGKRNRAAEAARAGKKMVVARPEQEIKGHSGYLTFATRL